MLYVLVVPYMNRKKRHRMALVGEQRDNTVWALKPAFASYVCGYDKPHYPVPAIAMSVKWIGDVANPFYGISIRDNAGKGWANFTWSPAYGWEYHPREQWQCEYCGGYHRSEDCTI